MDAAMGDDPSADSSDYSDMIAEDPGAGDANPGDAGFPAADGSPDGGDDSGDGGDAFDGSANDGAIDSLYDDSSGDDADADANSYALALIPRPVNDMEYTVALPVYGVYAF